MYLRMVRGLTRTARAATSVATHPDSADGSASSGRECPRVRSSPTPGRVDHSGRGWKALYGGPGHRSVASGSWGRASEATLIRLRWLSAFSGQRELLGADGTWV